MRVVIRARWLGPAKSTNAHSYSSSSTTGVFSRVISAPNELCLPFLPLAHTHINSQRALTRTHYTMPRLLFPKCTPLFIVSTSLQGGWCCERARDQITNRHFLFYLAFAFWNNELTCRARGSEGHSDGPQGADRPFNINYSRPELVVLMRAHATSPSTLFRKVSSLLHHFRDGRGSALSVKLFAIKLISQNNYFHAELWSNSMQVGVNGKWSVPTPRIWYANYCFGFKD